MTTKSLSPHKGNESTSAQNELVPVRNFIIKKNTTRAMLTQHQGLTSAEFKAPFLNELVIKHKHMAQQPLPLEPRRGATKQNINNIAMPKTNNHSQVKKQGTTQ